MFHDRDIQSWDFRDFEEEKSKTVIRIFLGAVRTTYPCQYV